MIYYLTRSTLRIASILPKDSLSTSATLVDSAAARGFRLQITGAMIPHWESRLLVLAWTELYQDIYDSA
ncbi:hypothetical protein RHDE110596_15330 [Prescottella defluvii]